MAADAGQHPDDGRPGPGWAWDEAEIRRAGYQVVDAIAAHLSGIAGRPVFRPFPAGLAGDLARAEPPGRGTAAGSLLAEAAGIVLGYPLGNGHPRFWAWVNSPPHVLGVLADALAAAANPSVAGGNHAAVHIERTVVRWFCALAGLPDAAAGLMVSGGSMATLTALAVARDQAVRRGGGDVRAAGLAGPAASPGRLRLYLTAEAHSCARKAAELLGLGSGSISVIGTDDRDQMRPDLLDAQLRRDTAAGLMPLAVVASAGTVNTGAIDPIGDIADACARHGAWLHIDGAYGGPAVLLLAEFAVARGGLSRADSIAIDPHKWLYAPVDAGLVLLRDGRQARDAFSLVPPYLRTAGDAGDAAGVTGPVWFSELGFEQTRPLRALKVWLLLRHLGLDGYRQLIAHDLRMARMLAGQIEAATDLELLAHGLSVCCFRATPAGVPAAALNQLNRDLVTRLQLGGRLFLAGTTVRGCYAMRACIVNPGTSPADVQIALAEIRAQVAELIR